MGALAIWIQVPAPSAAKTKERMSQTQQTAKEEGATEKAEPVTEECKSNCKTNKQSKF